MLLCTTSSLKVRSPAFSVRNLGVAKNGQTKVALPKKVNGDEKPSPRAPLPYYPPPLPLPRRAQNPTEMGTYFYDYVLYGNVLLTMGWYAQSYL